MTEAKLELSIQSLRKACKGNVDALPSFMVHDDATWPNGAVVQPDSKGRLHLRRSTFNRTVARSLPVKEGVWHRIDCQEFHLDLEPHHLDGDGSNQDGAARGTARQIARMDSKGRLPTDEHYGSVDRPVRAADVEADRREAKDAGTSGSVRSTAFDEPGARSGEV